jgi:hypothetical protein
MKEEAARWGARVDRVGEALELDSQLVKFSNQVNQIFDAPAQPVQLPNDERIAFAQRFQRFRELWAFRATAACFFVKELLTSRIGQRIDLQIEVLVLGGDARVADQHDLPLLPLSQR